MKKTLKIVPATGVEFIPPLDVPGDFLIYIKSVGKKERKP